MQQFKMKPFQQPPDLRIEVPGSKSITNRALLLAALAQGESTLKGVLFSDDSRVFMEALKTLGYRVEIDEQRAQVTVEGRGREIPHQGEEIYVGSAGTAARFLTAMLALSGESYHMTSSGQMKKRPMKPLLKALEQLGAVFEFEDEPYAFPFTIRKRKQIIRERVELNIDESSQFLSAMLLCGVLVPEGYEIVLTGQRKAKSYVQISMKMMREFGCEMEQISENTYRLLPGQSYRAMNYQVEPDVSAACYFYAMAAVNGGRALVFNVFFDSTQGDIQFLKVLESMGCDLEEKDEGILLTGPDFENGGCLRGINVRMSDFSDQSMTLAAVSVFARGQTEISGIGHIRRQESNRIQAMVNELRRLGVDCEEKEDGIVITPGELFVDDKNPIVVQTYEDHRMAMSFAIWGTRLKGIIIDNPMCCTKTFEKFFEVLTNLDLCLE